MRRLLIGFVAVITVGQQLTPPEPFTRDDFVNTFAGKLGLSADVVRGALRQAVVQVPENPDRVVTQVAPPDKPPAVSGGPFVSMNVDDGLVNSLAGALSLEPSTVRKALMETLEDVPLDPPAALTGGPAGKTRSS